MSRLEESFGILACLVFGSYFSRGKTLNCGQTCVAPDYVLVDKSIELQLEAKMKQVVQEWYGDNPQTNSNYSR